jgi:hypothetical protein
VRSSSEEDLVVAGFGNVLPAAVAAVELGFNQSAWLSAVLPDWITA